MGKVDVAREAAVLQALRKPIHATYGAVAFPTETVGDLFLVAVVQPLGGSIMQLPLT